MRFAADIRHRFSGTVVKWAGCAGALLLAAVFGHRASFRWLFLLVTGMGALVLLREPALGLLALVPAALVIPMEFSTGSAVALNPATLLVPALLALWVLDIVRGRATQAPLSHASRPLLLFVLASLLSLLIGNVIWSPAVPRPATFWLVQLAQWGIFLFSAGAFWLTSNLVQEETWLRRLTFFFLVTAGSLALVVVLFGGVNLVQQGIVTLALYRAPFWMLLAALIGGQLLFNDKLAGGWRLFLLASLGAVLIYVFYLGKETISNWLGVVAVAGVLAWLRWPRLRPVVVLLIVVLAGTGFLFSAVYDFAGGGAEWSESGGSRLTLIGRVLEVTMHNPVTGLGPAAYRLYAGMKPLAYEGALWVEPRINSHNNYVDLFSQVGLLGLGFFVWFAVELTRLGLRLRDRFTEGFASGYVNGMVAAWAGALVLMLLADWILPFVYNIGFPGFQASVLVWLFLGGLVALERIAQSEAEA